MNRKFSQFMPVLYILTDKLWFHLWYRLTAVFVVLILIMHRADTLPCSCISVMASLDGANFQPTLLYFPILPPPSKLAIGFPHFGWLAMREATLSQHFFFCRKMYLNGLLH